MQVAQDCDCFTFGLVGGSSIKSFMADSGVETQTIESIELKVDDDPNEDHIDIKIEQVTEETEVVSGSDEELARDEMVVITDQDLIGMSDSSKERSTEVSTDINKVYEEWIYVDVNKSTFEVKENLLLLSSVYGNGQLCCSIM